MDHLITSRRSSLLAALASQVQTLRICLAVGGAIVLVLFVAFIIVSSRHPLVIGLDERVPTVMMVVDDPSTFSVPEVKAFIHDLISKKFPKSPMKTNLAEVCQYFTEGPQAACQKELTSKKTFIPQDVIIDEVVWNERNESAVVKLKRFATFNGTVSQIESSLHLKLTKRSRTQENPWGIFVDSWKEEIKK